MSKRKPTDKETELFSTPRLEKYGNNMEFYYANIRESMEIIKFLSVFEVALRNYVDKFLKMQYHGNWLFKCTHFESLRLVINVLESHFYKDKTVVLENIKKAKNIVENKNFRKPQDIYDDIIKVFNKHDVTQLGNLTLNDKEKSTKHSQILDILYELYDSNDNNDKLNRIMNIILYGKQNEGKNVVTDYIQTPHAMNEFGDIIEGIYKDLFELLMKSEPITLYAEIENLLLIDEILNIKDIIISRLSFGFWVHLRLVPAPIPKKSKIEIVSICNKISEKKLLNIKRKELKSKQKDLKIKSEELENNLRKILKLRNRCSHEERIIDIIKGGDGIICYKWTQETADAINSISLVSKELFDMDIIEYCNENIPKYVTMCSD